VRRIYTPESLGFKRCTEADLYGGDTPEDAALIFDNVLNNCATEAQTNCVVINAAFAIQVIHPEKSIEDCIAIASESLKSGKAMKSFKQFVELNS
jgi:Anthranilate phosphoribosyltransferase